jgi:hypothetical protein
MSNFLSNSSRIPVLEELANIADKLRQGDHLGNSGSREGARTLRGVNNNPAWMTNNNNDGHSQASASIRSQDPPRVNDGELRQHSEIEARRRTEREIESFPRSSGALLQGVPTLSHNSAARRRVIVPQSRRLALMQTPVGNDYTNNQFTINELQGSLKEVPPSQRLITVFPPGRRFANENLNAGSDEFSNTVMSASKALGYKIKYLKADDSREAFVNQFLSAVAESGLNNFPNKVLSELTAKLQDSHIQRWVTTKMEVLETSFQSLPAREKAYGILSSLLDEIRSTEGTTRLETRDLRRQMKVIKMSPVETLLAFYNRIKQLGDDFMRAGSPVSIVELMDAFVDGLPQLVQTNGNGQQALMISIRNSATANLHDAYATTCRMVRSFDMHLRLDDQDKRSFNSKQIAVLGHDHQSIVQKGTPIAALGYDSSRGGRAPGPMRRRGDERRFAVAKGAEPEVVPSYQVLYPASWSDRVKCNKCPGEFHARKWCPQEPMSLKRWRDTKGLKDTTREPSRRPLFKEQTRKEGPPPSKQARVAAITQEPSAEEDRLDGSDGTMQYHDQGPMDDVYFGPPGDGQQ